MAFILGSYPQNSWANGFTGEEFAAWTENQQKAYLEAQLVMASTIATRNDANRAKCISDTFFDQRGLANSVFNEAMSRIAEFAEYHPSSVLVVMIEGECGVYQ